MKNRSFYIIAYDISNPRTLQKVGKAVRAYLTSGQKSVVECWMTDTERKKLLRKLSSLIDYKSDRIHCFRLDPRQNHVFLGLAKRTDGQPFIIV